LEKLPRKGGKKHFFPNKNFNFATRAWGEVNWKRQSFSAIMEQCGTKLLSFYSLSNIYSCPSVSARD
jgi:hypothetical protein